MLKSPLDRTGMARSSFGSLIAVPWLFPHLQLDLGFRGSKNLIQMLFMILDSCCHPLTAFNCIQELQKVDTNDDLYEIGFRCSRSWTQILFMILDRSVMTSSSFAARYCIQWLQKLDTNDLYEIG